MLDSGDYPIEGLKALFSTEGKSLDEPGQGWFSWLTPLAFERAENHGEGEGTRRPLSRPPPKRVRHFPKASPERWNGNLRFVGRTYLRRAPPKDRLPFMPVMVMQAIGHPTAPYCTRL